MSVRLGKKLRGISADLVAFMCPGCKELHQIRVRTDGANTGGAWGYNQNPDAPTFSPSIKVTGKQSVIIDGERTGEWVLDENGRVKDMCCHSFVKDGHIQFLGDCTHDLKNQTVELPDIEVAT